MTKRIRFALVGAVAAGAFALPASPASAAECINMGTTPVECTLEMLATDVQECYRLGTFVYECIPASGL